MYNRYHKPNAAAEAASPNERVVMPKNHFDLMDDLAALLGIAGDESAEVRWSDELYKRKVLRAAASELNKAWNGA